MTLLQALAIAGNASEDATLKRVRVIRGDVENPEIFTVNVANAMNKRRYKKFYLKDGDIVYIPKKNSEKFMYTTSWINNAMSTILLGDSFVKLFEKK
jgi:protein involved in polysaccharide export with SLBB domain